MVAVGEAVQKRCDSDFDLDSDSELLFRKQTCACVYSQIHSIYLCSALRYAKHAYIYIKNTRRRNSVNSAQHCGDKLGFAANASGISEH